MHVLLERSQSTLNHLLILLFKLSVQGNKSGHNNIQSLACLSYQEKCLLLDKSDRTFICNSSMCSMSIADCSN